MTSLYQNTLSVTSQFSFCGLPFRMDTYSGCAFNCTYCFARLRGGNVPSKKIRYANAETIISKYKKAIKNNVSNSGIITEYIKNEMPVHFGGMSDPFQPIEKTKKISLKVLEFLCSINYPIIISTKSSLISEEPYLSVLKSNPKILVQFSLSTTFDSIAKITEPFSTAPSIIFKTIETLSKNNIKTSVRWQPYIPNISEDPSIFIKKISNLGIKHLSLEHLKLALEKNNPLINRLQTSISFDLREFYKAKKCFNDGREYILPASEKIGVVNYTKSELAKYKITFGAADNELQYLSDTFCCCSGADQFSEFKNWNKFQIAHAVKKSQGKEIYFGLIENEWYPKGSIDKHLNSSSRIQKSKGHNTILSYIRNRWNNLNSSFNPTNFWGVIYNGKQDKDHMNVYDWTFKMF